MKKLLTGLVALTGIGLLALLYMASTQSTGGPIASNCIATWANSSTTVNTTATRVFSADQMNCPIRIQNDSVNNIFCWLENKTAASSSIQVNSGLKLGAVSTTYQGEPVITFGSDPGDVNGRGYPLNCIASGAASRLLILRK